MSKNEGFIREIIELQKLIQLFHQQYDPNVSSDFSEMNEQLLALRKITIPLIQSHLKKSKTNVVVNKNQQTSDNPDKIEGVEVLEPRIYKRKRRLVLLKGSVRIAIKTSSSNCNLDKVKKEILFSNGSKATATLNSINQQGKIVQASISIDFTGHLEEQNKQTFANVSIGGFASEPIYYIPNTSIDVSTDEKIENTIKKYVYWTKKMRLGTGTDEVTAQEITLICPNLSISKDTVIAQDLEQNLDKIPFIQKTQGGSINLQTLSFDELKELRGECNNIRRILRKAFNSSGYFYDILNNLGALAYPTFKEKETEEARKSREAKIVKADNILKADYEKQCASSKSLIRAIKNKMTILNNFERLIISELIARSLPKDLINQSNALKQMIVTQDEVLAPIVLETKDYYERTVTFNTFEEWKVVLDRINPILNQFQTEWDSSFNALKATVTAYETSNTEGLNSAYYEQWKNNDYLSFIGHIESEEPTIKDIKLIKDYLEAIQGAIDKTGGDGTMEFLEKEDKASDAEKARFEHDTIPTVFPFENTGKDLFTDGPQKTDIQQGEVGDCYLMSALISLTKDNTDLIYDMIDDQGDKCIVTLYQGGVPVKVEVSKKLMVKKVEGYKDSTPAAQHAADIWAPIIEKAYAKLLGSSPGNSHGDLTKIEGGSTTEALKVLLGNKVKTPEKIYLDEHGAIVAKNPSETIVNPIILSTIDLNALKRVLQAANEADYEIHVSSPDKYKGHTLGHHDVLPIDAHHFMSFNHAYSLVNATANTITIRNPHGDSEREQGIFSEAVKTAVVNLIDAVDVVEKKFDANTTISTSEKTAMDNAIQAVSRNTLIAPRFSGKIKLWNNWMNDLAQDPADSNNWKPNQDSKKKVIKRLKKQIMELKKGLTQVAEYNSKDKSKDTKLRDGFLNKTISLSAEQTITYEVLKDFFERVNLSVIKP